MVENPELIPPDGQPWSVSPSPSRFLSLTSVFSIVCANHSNSLTDALCVLRFQVTRPALLTPCRHSVLVATIPSKVRNTCHPTLRLSTLTTAPSKKRSLLRLTAKATQFGKRTFTSWLIESAGTVPIKRRSDYSEDAQVDNTEVMSHLMDV